MAVSGDLKDIPITNLLQMNCQAGASGRLALRHDDQTGLIFLQQGEIVHAGLGKQTGPEAFFAMLAWRQGEFHFTPDIQSPVRSIQTRWADLLLQGVQRLDEQSAASVIASEAKQSPTTEPVSPQELSALFGLEAQTDNLSVSQEKNMANNLDNLLRDLGNDIPGFIAVTVAGNDGLLIGYYSKKSGVDPEMISAQFALVMSLVRRVANKLDAGAVEDNLVTTRDFYVINQALGDGSYWLGVMASRDAKLGALRMYLRQYLPTLAKALPGQA